MTPLQKVLSRLPDAKQRGGEWIAKCPAHDDGTASLGVSEGREGRAILHCLAGCEPEAVVDALELTMRDLMPESEPQRKEVAAYDYTDAAGRLLFQVVRYEPKKFLQRRPDGAGGWIWNLRGVDRVLYRLPEVLKAIEAGWTVYLVEGEKDADNLARLGLVATTNAGGAKKWSQQYSRDLKGAVLVVLPDNDDPGRRHAEKVAAETYGSAASLRIVALPHLPPKGDVSDWLKNGGTKERLEELTAAAAAWSPPPGGTAPGEGKSSAGDAYGSYGRNFEIDLIEKVCTSEPRYHVHVAGVVVTMSADDLLTFSRFQRAVVRVGDFVPDMRNPALMWMPYVNACLRERRVDIAAATDASDDEAVWHRVAHYLQGKSSSDESVLAERRGVLAEDGRLYFHGPSLQIHLAQRGTLIPAGELWDLLRKHGVGHTKKRVRNSAGKSFMLSAWYIPQSALPEEDEV